MGNNEWERDLMTAAETAEWLKVPVSWVYERSQKRGRDRIPYFKFGKDLRFERVAVRAWLEGQRSY